MTSRGSSWPLLGHLSQATCIVLTCTPVLLPFQNESSLRQCFFVLLQSVSPEASGSVLFWWEVPKTIYSKSMKERTDDFCRLLALVTSGLACYFLAQQKNHFLILFCPVKKSRHALVEIRQKELVLPSLILVNTGCRMCYHLTWRKWKMEPSQLFLRSLKVIKESNKRLESNHCNKLEAQSIKKKLI